MSLTAADFARCMGHTTTPAMEADVLDAPAPSTPTAPEVPPEVQAVLDARAVLAAAEAEESALPPFVYGMGDAEIVRRNRITGTAGAARRALRQLEGVVYVPDTTPVGSLRAANARVNALHNEIGAAEGALRTAKLRNATKAIAKHEAALVPLRAALAEHLTIRTALEAVVYPD